MWDAMYIGSTQQTFKKITGGSFLQSPNYYQKRTKIEQHFKYATSHTYFRNCMTIKVVDKLNLIGEMKKNMKTICNLYMEELITIINKIHGKRVMVTKKNS